MRDSTPKTDFSNLIGIEQKIFIRILIECAYPDNILLKRICNKVKYRSHFHFTPLLSLNLKYPYMQ